MLLNTHVTHNFLISSGNDGAALNDELSEMKTSITKNRKADFLNYNLGVPEKKESSIFISERVCTT